MRLTPQAKVFMPRVELRPRLGAGRAGAQFERFLASKNRVQ